MGLLVKAMYGTRDAPQIWAEEVKKDMDQLQFESSVLHLSVSHKRDMQTFVVVHVDDFLCVGPWEELELLYTTLKKVYDLKNSMFRKGGGR